MWNKKIIIATHYLVYGAPQALREYLIEEKIAKLLFLAHPLQIDNTKSYKEVIRNGLIEKKINSGLRTGVSCVNYLMEMGHNVFWTLMEKEKFDLWIGVDSLNAFCGIFLKKIGKVKKVIYYTIDYVPLRFDSKIFNSIYHWLDRFCLKNSDETWNVSHRIAEGREKEFGLKQAVYNKQKIVPIGIWFDRVKRLPFELIKKHQLLFVGNLLEKQGVQLVLEAIPDIIKKISDFHFLIVGGGEYESQLREKAKKLKLDNYVTFTGWIKEREKLDEIMADSAVAIAMYDKSKDNFTYYADPTKLKDYLSAGLPIILTDVPHNALEIEKNGCGVIVSYDKDEIASALCGILADETGLKKYRENAIQYIRQFEWKNIFERTLSKIFSKDSLNYP